MTVQEIYTKYQIIPSLQLHQYRVAGVGLIISESMVGVKVDHDAVVKACLLHDMGNIIKFNMALFPQFFEPEGVRYWSDVKRSFIQKYGQDEHDATIAIARELLISNIQCPKLKINLTPTAFWNSLKQSVFPMHKRTGNRMIFQQKLQHTPI